MNRSLPRLEERQTSAFKGPEGAGLEHGVRGEEVRREAGQVIRDLSQRALCAVREAGVLSSKSGEDSGVHTLVPSACPSGSLLAFPSLGSGPPGLASTASPCPVSSSPGPSPVPPPHH